VRHFSKLLLVVLSSAALILGLSLLPGQKAEGKSGATPVYVTNSSVPVSVSGTPSVNITNSSLPVTLSGAVDLASGSSVLVGNTTDGSGNPVPLVTRNADGPAGSAMQAELCDEIGGSTACDSETNSSGSSITVPTDERLVIQFASGKCVAPSGSFATVELQTTVGGTTFDHEILLHPVPSSDFSEMSQRVRVYADPSSTVHLYETNGGSTTGYCTLGISGYTVPYTPAP
jgi:hypothetical protein